MCVWQPGVPIKNKPSYTLQKCCMTALMEAFNHSMSTVRESVEWLFSDIINYFKFMDFRKNLKIGLSSIGRMYVVCAILRNPLTCLYGNQTSSFFQLEPPSLGSAFLKGQK